MALANTESSVSIDLAAIAKSLELPAPRVESVVRLLDDGNTVPFITRYRKDQTGGLDEDQIRAIHERVVKARLLAERKQTILRSIDSQGRLTPELAAALAAADTTRRLEDLYLPYKPKKQTLATTARSRGLEPLALEILHADPQAADLDARLRDFVNLDKQISSPADALLGAGHILAEIFSERADFRGRVRSILHRSGRLVSSAVEPESKPAESTAAHAEEGEKGSAGERESQAIAEAAVSVDEERPLFAGLTDEGGAPQAPTPPTTAAEAESAEAPPADPFELHVSPIVSVDPSIAATSETPETVGSPIVAAASEEVAASEQTATAEGTLPAPAVAAEAQPSQAREKKKDKKKKKKPLSQSERKAADLQRAFRDYFQYSESVGRVPPHRVLAINRGEKIKVLRVRIDSDTAAMEKFIDEVLVPRDHPHAEFLRGCGRDALHRLVLPSLERELRREMTDAAERHAVDVFAKNLRNLLLQPPVRDRRLLALDPGFKSGCKWVALDEFGNLLEHGVTFVIGNAERRTESRAKLVEAVKQHQSSVIVIGNGTACRETENFVADLLTNDLAGLGVSYVIVSECGASVYSASPLGREEFPQCDATVRGAVSIGRRLQDPLSELVKIDPASLGVGLYQHDVKAKHLRDSLDDVVEWCVNYVGVDLNTAGPALLRYVSGLNQLTAQRIYEHRKEHGPFRNRAQLKEVSGIGEAAFVQAAGFLKITGGDEPLDVTWIHPESYPVAERLLEQLGSDKPDLLDKEKVGKLAERARGVDMQRTSLQLKVGTLTLHDIINQLTRPGRDPRDALPPPIFKQGILKLDDLAPGMELRGTVLNVVDFGAFVDIGLKDSGLVHISQLADKYVKDPHEVVSVGDVVKVWVLEVDKQRRRVSLTMIAPGSKRADAPPHSGEREASQHAERPRGRDRGPYPNREGQGRGPGGGSRFGGKPGQGGRPEGDRGGRRDRRPPRRDQDQDAPPVVEVKSNKPPPPAKLTKAKLQGRAYLQSFGELTQFLTVAKPAEPAEPSLPVEEQARTPVADTLGSPPPESSSEGT